MESQILPESPLTKEREDWQRILERRRSEWAELNPSVLEGIIRVPWSLLAIKPAFVASKEKFDWIISKSFELSINSKISPSKRRAALLLLKKLLEKSDKAWCQHRNYQDACDEREQEIQSSNMTNGLFSSREVIPTCPMELVRTTESPIPVGIDPAPGDRQQSLDPVIISLPDPSLLLAATSSDLTTKPSAKKFDAITVTTSSTLHNNYTRTCTSSSLPTGLHKRLEIVTTTSEDHTPGIPTSITAPHQAIHLTNQQSLEKNGVASSNALPTGPHKGLEIVTTTSEVPRPGILTSITAPQQAIYPTNQQFLETSGVVSSNSLLTRPKKRLKIATTTLEVPTLGMLTSITAPQQAIHPKNQQSIETNGVVSSHNSMRAAQLSVSTTSEVSKHSSRLQERINPQEQEPGELTPLRSPSMSRGCTPDLATPPSHILQSSPMTIFFPPDDNKYYGGLTARPVIKTLHRPKNLTADEMNKINRRFAIWDPYWKMEEILVLQQTCQLDYCDLRKDTDVPVNRAVGCKFQLTPDQMALVKGWGHPRDKKSYDHHEARLLVRMIPLQEPTKKSEKDKKARADFHIWPKGTFLSIGGIATQINQRKQMNHDHSYWQGLSHFLDVTSHVSPKSSARFELSIDVCCFENKPYVVCIAICRFHKPLMLYENLMAKAIDKLSMKEAVQIALKMTAQNVVVLDNAESDDQNGSFILKLTCAISSSLMLTPVRAKKCKHFQCFDLQNFLEVNQHVSGTRWECPVCNTELISVYELELCSLTNSLLNQYKDLASAQQDRVEFFSDGTWQLLDEKKKRYGVKRSQTESTNLELAKIPKVAEVIDLL